MIGSKAQPTNTLLPVIAKQKSVSIRALCSVRRILHEQNGKQRHAKGVVYVDSAGQEIFQPADLVILSSWTLNNTRLLLLSGIGQAYTPISCKGTLGRNLTHQVIFQRSDYVF
jgi:gluconate 2-dehydrogenase alpha chain